MTDSTRARGGGGSGAAGGAARPDGPLSPDGARSPGGAAAEVLAPHAAGQDPQGSGQAQQGDGADQPGGPVLLLEPRDGPAKLVASVADLDRAVAALAAGHGPVAVDAERASGFRYGHRAFLVQLRRDGAGTMLIDPMACPNLTGLDEALASTEVVLHAASQDLPCLAELGFRPRALFDTELAGRLLGFPRVGLGALVESVLGWTLEKGHAAADWSVRPLSAELLRYAALDVELLVELRDALAAQLVAQGKAEWAEQEFAAVLAAKPPGPRPDPWRRTSGIHRVHSRRGLAMVRELWQERDKIARRRDQSPGRVLPDTAIVEAARVLPGSQADLTDLPGFKGRGARKHSSAWLRAVQRARGQADTELPGPAIPPLDGPPPTHRWQERDPVAAQRLAAVRTVVAALADEHTVPAENLLPPDVVRRLAWQPPDPVGPDEVAADLAAHGARPWQVGLTALPISRALGRLAEKAETGETAEAANEAQAADS
ncbi:MAG TPA: ribonuclease D [Streptosporangiaceae bacterium]